MEDLTHDDKILVFTRMPEAGFDEFMGDPEAVIATVEDMGFNQDEMLRSLTSSGDPSQLLQLMEGRWSGEEMNFAFESYWPLLQEKFPLGGVLKMIIDEGRNSQIYTDYGEIRVLSQAQVARASKELAGVQLDDMASTDEADFMLENLFPALQKFFSCAAEGNEFVLVSHI